MGDLEFFSVDAELAKQQEFAENMTAENELRIEREIDAAYEIAKRSAQFEISPRSFALWYWAAVKTHGGLSEVLTNWASITVNDKPHV